MSTELKRVIYVDDDPDILKLAELSFKMEGKYELSLFKSGCEVLKRIEAMDPQMILLDVMMPEMDGITLCKKLRLIPGFESKPIFFVTAKVQMQDDDFYRQSGADGVIQKPFSLFDLPEKIGQFWQSHMTAQGTC